MGNTRLILAAFLAAAATEFVEAQPRTPPGSNPYPPSAPAVQYRPAPAAAPQPRNQIRPPAAQNNGSVSAQRPRNPVRTAPVRNETGAAPPQHGTQPVPAYVVYPYWDAYGYGYWYPYGWWHDFLFPPVYLPPDAMLGPQVWPPTGTPPPPANRVPAPPEPNLGDQRATNDQATAMGTKFIGYGDAWFAKGKFFEANARYRDAARSAPQLADAYFRQGFALAALGQYSPAVKALRHGLALEPKWPGSGFKLDDLYGSNAAAKEATCRALTRAAAEKPNDADLAFLLGVYMHFDHQPDLAKQSFERAARLVGNHSEHIEPFLNKQNGLLPDDDGDDLP